MKYFVVKGLIWFASILCLLFIEYRLLIATNYRLGVGFFFLLGWFFATRGICRSWEKNRIITDAKKSGVTPFDIIKEKVPAYVLAECETLRGKKEEVEKYLNEQQKDMNIKKIHREFLLQEYLSEKDFIKVTQTKVNSDLCGNRLASGQVDNGDYNKEKSQSSAKREMANRRSLGMKWYTFYVKVRPLLGLAIFISSIFTYGETYLMLMNINFVGAAFAIPTIIYIVLDVAYIIANMILFFKERNEFGESLLGFIKKLLVFEVFYIPYSSILGQYYEGQSIMVCMVVMLIWIAISYFVWYRLNIKYFRKRLAPELVNSTANGKTLVESLETSDEIESQIQEILDGTNVEQRFFYPKQEPSTASSSVKRIVVRKAKSTSEPKLTSEKNIPTFCRKCGIKLNEGSMFCHKCGTQVIKE